MDAGQREVLEIYFRLAGINPILEYGGQRLRVEPAAERALEVRILDNRYFRILEVPYSRERYFYDPNCEIESGHWGESRYRNDFFVLVSDGAEDESVIPLITGRVPMLSKQTITVKQAKEIESTYYVIKEALKDPFLARIVFGIPGIILLLYFFFGSYSFQLIAFVFGIYLLLKGFGLEEKILSNIEELKARNGKVIALALEGNNDIKRRDG